MVAADAFLLGEYPRTLDERNRVGLPPELATPLVADSRHAILAKERPGCLSLWNATVWKARLDQGIDLVKAKILAGRLARRIEDVQRLGRLLSTRHRLVELGDRARLLIPDGFRQFLGVEPGGEVLLIGAAVCVEIWRPENWVEHLAQEIPTFPQLLDDLSK